MRFVYTLFFYLAIPFILLRLLWRSRSLPAYRDRWKERFAILPCQVPQNGIWVHAVSFGESVVAEPIIRNLLQQFPNLPIVVTNMTPTGSEKIRKTFPDQVINFYLPYDLPILMTKFIKALQPKLMIIIETELWPNMLNQLKKQKIPVILANGRLSQNSYKNYAKVKGMFEPLLKSFQYLCVQTEEEAKRFQALGAKPESVKVTGSIKFDLKPPADIIEKAKALKVHLNEKRDIFLAASTHAGEEEKILRAFKQAQADLPDLLLILVPRHPDRFASVAKQCRQDGYKIAVRSENQYPEMDTDIYLADTMGELFLFYAIADVAFVGGSFVPVGGHNVLEPAALAKAIITGTHMHNFQKIAAIMLAAEAIIQVNDDDELAKKVVQLIQIPSLRETLGKNAQAVFEQNRGALKKHMQLISQFL